MARPFNDGKIGDLERNWHVAHELRGSLSILTHSRMTIGHFQRFADVRAENQFDDQAIHHASNLAVAGLLVAAGADVNSVTGEGGFPLKSAADAGDTALVRGLLRLGARVETTTTGEIAFILRRAKIISES